MIAWIIVGVLTVICSLLLFVVFRLSRKLLQFDDMIQMLWHDIVTNVKYLAKLVSTPVFSNSPEIIEVQKNMRIMGERLAEYLNRIEEVSNKRVMPPKSPVSDNPPVVV